MWDFIPKVCYIIYCKIIGVLYEKTFSFNDISFVQRLGGWFLQNQPTVES